MFSREREDYQKRIDDLLNAVTTLLNANNAMGEKLQKLEKIADAYDELKAENEKLKGEPRDLSNRPDHYEKGHADIHVVHDCDLDKLEEMGETELNIS